MGDFNGLRKGDLALFLMKWSPPLCFSLNFDFSVSSKSVDSAPVLCGSVGDVTSITKLEDSSKDCDDMSIKANYHNNKLDGYLQMGYDDDDDDMQELLSICIVLDCLFFISISIS